MIALLERLLPLGTVAPTGLLRRLDAARLNG
jgi:hypothetical protein